MKSIVEITTIGDPRIAPFATMRARKGWLSAVDLPVAADDSLIVAEGEKGILALMKSGITPLAMLAEAHYYQRLSKIITASGLPVDRQYVASRILMQQLVGYRMHQGVMVLAKAPDQTPLEKLSFPVVALNRLANAENVGAIIRTAVAFGVRSLLVDNECADPFLRRSIKVAMGAAFQINWHKTMSLPNALAVLKQRGATVVAAEALSTSISLRKYPIPYNSILVMGSEGEGIDSDVSDACDVSVAIPVDSSIDSLNVAAACAVLLYSITV